MRYLSVSVVSGLLISLTAPVASAATMTFDYIDRDAYLDFYEEDGITAVGDGAFGEYAVNVQHMDDMGTAAPSEIRFSMRRTFDALGFDLLPVAFDYTLCNMDTDECTKPTWQNVRIEGYRAETMVASLSLDMSLLDTARITFGPQFRRIDTLLIGFNIPPLWDELGEPMFADCGYPCSHFEIDNVTLAPVPLPAAGGLAALGVGLLGVLARRRTR